MRRRKGWGCWGRGGWNSGEQSPWALGSHLLLQEPKISSESGTQGQQGKGKGRGKASDMDRLIFFFQEGQPLFLVTCLLLGLVQYEGCKENSSQNQGWMWAAQTAEPQSEQIQGDSQLYFCFPGHQPWAGRHKVTALPSLDFILASPSPRCTDCCGTVRISVLT